MSNACFVSWVYSLRMAMELQQLRQVVALAEHRSFVRASAALHISQPAPVPQHPEPRAPVRQQPVPAFCRRCRAHRPGPALHRAGTRPAAHGRRTRGRGDRSCCDAHRDAWTSAVARTRRTRSWDRRGALRRAVSASQRTPAVRRLGRSRPPVAQPDTRFLRRGNQPARARAGPRRGADAGAAPGLFLCARGASPGAGQGERFGLPT